MTLPHTTAPSLDTNAKWIEPCYSSAYRALATGRNKDAFHLFTIMTLLAPKDYRAWTGLGTLFERTKQYSRASAMYGIAAALQPDCPSAWLAKARVLQILGKDQQAEKALQHANAAAHDQTPTHTTHQ